MKHILSADELFLALEEKKLLAHRDEWWWPNAGSFEVVLGAILTQNSRWNRVEESLKNLNLNSADTLEAISSIDSELLSEYIRPSGLYRQKSTRLIQLSKNIINDFGDFENFCVDVERGWLLKQKGIGEESADSILNYACKREAMVVDSYTKRLVLKVGLSFESYSFLQKWLNDGVKILAKGRSEKIALLQAQFHGMIVEYCKQECGKNR